MGDGEGVCESVSTGKRDVWVDADKFATRLNLSLVTPAGDCEPWIFFAAKRGAVAIAATAAVAREVSVWSCCRAPV